MKFKLRRLMVLFLTVMLCIATTRFSVLANPEPRVAVKVSMTTNVDMLEEIEANQEIIATVTWKSVAGQAGEPITIQATNGAEILISSEADVTFKANGTPVPVNSVTCSPDGGTAAFKSGPTANNPLDNEITFTVKAPSRPGDFNLSVKFGTDSPKPLINFTEKEFTVKPFISVNTSADSIVGDTPFEVFGELNYEDAYMIALSIHNKETGDVAFDATTMDIAGDGSYSLGAFAFNDTHAAGTYVVEVFLLDSNYNTVDTATKEIVYAKTVELTAKYVDIETGELIYSFTKSYEYGTEAVIPIDVYMAETRSRYELISTSVNGELVDNRKIYYYITVNEPTEIIFELQRTYGISILCVNASTGSHIASIVGGSTYLSGTTHNITAPDSNTISYLNGRTVVGVLVDGQRAALVNGNQVQLTFNKNYSIVFEYQ